MKKISDGKPDCGSLKCKTLIIHGEKYSTLFTDKFENRKKWVKPDVKKVISFLPGTVLEIYASVGETVEKDNIMMVLEAMKMRNNYYFPMSGKIKSVNVKAGERIPKGYAILEFE